MGDIKIKIKNNKRKNIYFFRMNYVRDGIAVGLMIQL